MNCSELRRDIDTLREARDLLGKEVGVAVGNGRDEAGIMSLMENTMQAADQILEKYLDTFFEKFPQLLQIRLGERIEGFKDKDGNEADIEAISRLPNGNMLVGGGALYEYQEQPDGSYRLSEQRIKGFRNVYGNESLIYAISRLPNGNMLVGGLNGTLYEYRERLDGFYELGKLIRGFKGKYSHTSHINAISPLHNGNAALVGGDDGALFKYQKQPDGSYKLGKRIEGFKDVYGREGKSIHTICPLPNGNMLVGGDDGALYEYRERLDGSRKPGRYIKGFKDKDGNEADIYIIYPLPNGNMLIGGRKGALYEYQEQPDGSYKLSERIEGFKDKDGNEVDIYAISPLPNGNMLIGGWHGTLYEYQKQPDGSYKLSEHIEGFKDKNGKETSVRTISPLPNGNMLIGGGDGALYEAYIPPKSLNTLKQSLDRIIN